MNLELRRYSGELAPAAESFTVHFDPTGLREIIRIQWSDARYPIKLAILPLEDYETICADLTGQVITPHRNACVITIPPAPPPPPTPAPTQSRWGRWAERSILWGICFLAAFGIWSLVRLAGNLTL